MKHAASSIGLTKLAIVFSIAVTVGATWWQVSITRDIDRQNTEQQRNVETLLREQLAAQKKFIEQQARDAEQLRELLQQQQTEDAKLPGEPVRSVKKTPTASQ